MADNAYQDLLNQVQSQLASGGHANAGQPQIYMGHTPATSHGGEVLVPDGSRNFTDPGSKSHDDFVSPDEAYLIPYQSDATRQGLGEQMYENGLISDPNDYAAINKMWQSAVDEAGNFHAAGRNLTPWQVLDIMAGQSGQKNQPKSRTTTQTQTNVPSSDDINQIVGKVFSDLTGRAPNPSEIKAYTGTLTAKAQDNPSKTTTTTQYDAQGNATSSNSITQNGADASALQYEAQQKLKGTDEYGAYQAAVPYYNVLASVINGNG